MKISKHCLSLAGEYRVCAELLKRGISASVTYGNMKAVDILAVGRKRIAAVVEVKASNSSRFVTKFYQNYKSREDVDHPTFWALYSVVPSGEGFTERFFILSHQELADIQARRNKTENLPYEERAERACKGVDNVLIQNVTEHEDKWAKIVDWCGGPFFSADR